MREIKFRAWHKEKKIMVKMTLDELSWDAERMFILKGVPEFYFEDCEWMQYTGLKDKNGKEIYEGDIMHIGSWKLVGKNPHAEVKYLQGFKVIVNYDLEEEPHTLVDCYVIQGGNATTVPLAEALQFFNEITVVGNIYENPELLKE